MFRYTLLSCFFSFLLFEKALAASSVKSCAETTRGTFVNDQAAIKITSFGQRNKQELVRAGGVLNSGILGMSDDIYVFVITENEDVFYSPRFIRRDDAFFHASHRSLVQQVSYVFNSSVRFFSAGEFHIRNGEVIELNNRSRTLKGGMKSLLLAKRVLKKKGLGISEKTELKRFDQRAFPMEYKDIPNPFYDREHTQAIINQIGSHEFESALLTPDPMESVYQELLKVVGIDFNTETEGLKKNWMWIQEGFSKVPDDEEVSFELMKSLKDFLKEIGILYSSKSDYAQYRSGFITQGQEARDKFITMKIRVSSLNDSEKVEKMNLFIDPHNKVLKRVANSSIRFLGDRVHHGHMRAIFEKLVGPKRTAGGYERHHITVKFLNGKVTFTEE